jgi:hypothetical protein
MAMRRAISRAAVLCALGSVGGTGCSADMTGGSGNAVVVAPGESGATSAPGVANAPAATPDDPRVEMVHAAPENCPVAPTLLPDQPVTGLAPGGGPVSTACMPSDAGQRFFTVVVPPRMQGIVRATPTEDSPAESLVLRVLPTCSAPACEQVHVSAAPGIQAVVTVHNPDAAPRTRVVTVSGMSAQELGRYDVVLELMPED